MQDTITSRRSKFVRYDEGAVMYSMSKNTFYICAFTDSNESPAFQKSCGIRAFQA